MEEKDREEQEAADLSMDIVYATIRICISQSSAREYTGPPALAH